MKAKKKAVIKSITVRKLMAYANKNPDASDTAEGIAKWWIRRPIDEVLAALESLVELGIWERVNREDRVLYRPILNLNMINYSSDDAEH